MRRVGRVLAWLSVPTALAVCLVLGYDPPDAAFLLVIGYTALVGERFDGRSAWLAGLAVAGWLTLFYVLTGEDSPGVLVLTVPGYLAGVALRLRRRAAEELAARGRELDRERERYAAVAVRNERARIAAELHDIVGHAVSVMVVQAAAGQRLVDRDPEAARAALDEVGAAARRGRDDLQRLLRLLGGHPDAPDLTHVREIVDAAAGAGLSVSCRVEGEAAAVDDATAHLALRVVQESLTNALRHAPGAAVRVVLRHVADPHALAVRIENDPVPASPDRPGPGLIGTGHGLAGLRSRVVDGGGTFAAGPADGGGWRVEACLTARP